MTEFGQNTPVKNHPKMDCTPSTEFGSSITGSPAQSASIQGQLDTTHPFQGRSVAVVNDLTVQEQWYLYQKTRELKEAVKNRTNLDNFRCKNPECAVYSIFMEDSTRTKESFRNAAEFHGMKVNIFDSNTSSFQKNETITDTIKMLVGYSTGQSLFVIRSKLEGVCRWLQEEIMEFNQRHGFPQASFINAGDGRHEHPSQEFLDEFSFLEHKGWDTASIHIALLGDLCNGRTVHSKVDGLKLYSQVYVDLIAPAELSLPVMYEKRMSAAGFHVRKFTSIEEYLNQPKVASIWYFTRLQLERMGEKVLSKSTELRQAVTFQQQFIDKLPANTKFFHPLPRDAKHPTLPFWLDKTKYNGWDQQSQNGYFTRIILLGMFSGHLGQDFSSVQMPIYTPRKTKEKALVLPASPNGTMPKPSSDYSIDASLFCVARDFVEEIQVENARKEIKSCEAGVMPISNGVVINHVAKGHDLERIWALLYMVRSVLGLRCLGGMGVYHDPPNRSKGENEGEAAGFLSFPYLDVAQLDRLPLKKLAAMVPGSILCTVADGFIQRRFKLRLPPRIYGLPDISCKNTACISYSSNMQHDVSAYFLRTESHDPLDSAAAAFACKYCEQTHSFSQIWDYKYYQGVTEK